MNHIRLQFHPQQWVGDYAYAAEPLGQLEWEVPLEDFLEVFPTRQKWGEEHELRDEMHLHDAAPEWVKEWEGPYEVTLENTLNNPWTP